MIWFSLALLVLVVMNLVMAWRIQALQNSVAQMWEAVHFYAMTGGTGKVIKAEYLNGTGKVIKAEYLNGNGKSRGLTTEESQLTISE